MAPVLRHCPCLRPESDDVKVLDYRHANLTDVPHDVFSFERTLEELYLDANQIRDLPRPLFHCHGLRKLGLSDNEIQALPPAVASLISLEELDISKNSLLEIPDNIKGCKCLISIEASVNPLGKLPEGLTQLLNLEQLYLNDTFLEYLPANFGRLSHLKIMELRENHLKVLPKSIARLTELVRLDIGQNDFSMVPEVVGSLPSLAELWCDCNNINYVPEFVGSLHNLTYLDLSKNKIYEISSEIGACTRLTDLTLSFNRLKELPETIGNLRSLTILRLDENRLGSLPTSLGCLNSLEELVVGSNDLSSLPSSVGLLRNLHTLMADDNEITALPQELGSCRNLAVLSLRDNRLASLPDEMGRLTNLRVLNLSGNLLQHLPFTMAKLTQLKALWLSENQNKPLVPLQSDVDRATGLRVLTCFMLPQVTLDNGPSTLEPRPSVIPGEREGKPLIKFAFEEDGERPGRLVRAPTPYPKELKAHARHARNIALKKQPSLQDQPILEQQEPLPAEVSQEARLVSAKPRSPSLSPRHTQTSGGQQAAEAQSNTNSDHSNEENEAVPSSQMYHSTAVLFNGPSQLPVLRYADMDRGYRSDQEVGMSSYPTHHDGGYASDWESPQGEPPPVHRLLRPTPAWHPDSTDVKMLNDHLHPCLNAPQLSPRLSSPRGWREWLVPPKSPPPQYHTAVPIHRPRWDYPPPPYPGVSSPRRRWSPQWEVESYLQAQHNILPEPLPPRSHYLMSAADSHAPPKKIAPAVPPKPTKPDLGPPPPDVTLSAENALNQSAARYNAAVPASKTPWIFGVHRNPQVFPVAITRDPDLGFSIEGGVGTPRNPCKPSDTGIYVSHVLNGGPACTALKAGDKILQVNGIDLANLPQQAVEEVLRCAGPSLSMMVSRDS